ncbi:MAG: ORF6N domain-containing protein, partial [Spirochaetia bacterium]|nr:ORF6N domain-containing protein [Spirochaetia bacterium]
EDFMFQLSDEEFINWKSQFVTSNSDKMGLRKKPYAFTQNGIAMLSSVLNSEMAIQVNIQIMRVFVKLKEQTNINTELKFKFQKIDMKLIDHDKKFGMVFDAIKEIQRPPEKTSTRVKKVKYTWNFKKVFTGTEYQSNWIINGKKYR